MGLGLGFVIIYLNSKLSPSSGG